MPPDQSFIACTHLNTGRCITCMRGRTCMTDWDECVETIALLVLGSCWLLLLLAGWLIVCLMLVLNDWHRWGARIERWGRTKRCVYVQGSGSVETRDHRATEQRAKKITDVKHNIREETDSLCLPNAKIHFNHSYLSATSLSHDTSCETCHVRTNKN